VTRTEASRKATRVRMQRARRKVQDAVNIFMLYNRKVTVLGISKEAGVDRATAKKYLLELGYLKSTQTPETITHQVTKPTPTVLF